MTSMASPDSAVVYLPLAAITEDPDQPRKIFDPRAVEDLARSIESAVSESEQPWIDGLLHPIVVYPLLCHDDKNEPAYRILAGARRYRAYKLRQWPEIPARVIERPSSRAQLLLLQMAENNARENTSLWEDSIALRAALEAWTDENPQGTRQEFARLCGRSASWLSHQLRVTEATGLAHKAVRDGHIQHAETLRLFQKMPEELQYSLLKHARVHKATITAGLLRQHIPQKASRSLAVPSTAEASQKQRKIQIRLTSLQIRRLLSRLGVEVPDGEESLPGALVQALTEEPASQSS